jgi:hypothetical protein
MFSGFSRRAASSTTMGLVLAVVLVLVVLGVLLFGPVKMLKKGSGDISSLTACNSNQRKCACLFEDNYCPSDAVSTQDNSEDCPSEGYGDIMKGGCKATFDVSLKKAKSDYETLKNQDDPNANRVFGTCCVGNWKDHPSLRK